MTAGGVVRAVIRIRLIEARLPTIVAPEHCFIAAIAIKLVTGEFLWLERYVGGTVGIRTPGIQLKRADDRAGAVRHPLRLGYRGLRYPVDPSSFSPAAAALVVRRRRFCDLNLIGTEVIP